MQPVHECHDSLFLQRPEIDYSDEGITPEQFDSTIEFKNVCFSYPTRPDVQASVLTYIRLCHVVI